jgi:hypothetical protein
MDPDVERQYCRWHERSLSANRGAHRRGLDSVRDRVVAMVHSATQRFHNRVVAGSESALQSPIPTALLVRVSPAQNGVPDVIAKRQLKLALRMAQLIDPVCDRPFGALSCVCVCVVVFSRSLRPTKRLARITPLYPFTSVKRMEARVGVVCACYFRLVHHKSRRPRAHTAL